MKKTVIAIFIGIALIGLGGCRNLQVKPSKAAQIEFLKKNEALMTEYVKSAPNDSGKEKIESVTFNWDTVETDLSDPSNPVGKEDTLVLVEGIYINGDKNMNASLFVTLSNFSELKGIKTIGISAPSDSFFDKFLRKGWTEYHG